MGFLSVPVFRVSRGPESFNRPLIDKINDVASPTYHAVLATMATTHVVPRAYLWGFADTIRPEWRAARILSCLWQGIRL